MTRGLPQLLAVGCALVLAGCSGTPFGDQLARSFSGSQAGVQPPGPDSPASAGADSGEEAKAAQGKDSTTKHSTTKDSTAKDAKTKDATANSAADKAAQDKPKAPEPRALPAPVPIAPAPYRVTIKLPAADPSAPAEAVTRALRAAGLSFEVETIERVRNGSQGQSPSVTPAPQPR